MGLDCGPRECTKPCAEYTATLHSVGRLANAILIPVLTPVFLLQTEYGRGVPGLLFNTAIAAGLNLIGGVKVAPAAEVRDLYLSCYESARYWQDFTDFAYYRLEVEGVYFIGGFGVMGWVPAAEYATAAPDPLATVAPEIIQHMNADHSDALRRIVGQPGAWQSNSGCRVIRSNFSPDDLNFCLPAVHP